MNQADIPEATPEDDVIEHQERVEYVIDERIVMSYHYRSGVDYKAGSLVVHDGKLYSAIVDFTSSEVFNGSDWDLLNKSGRLAYAENTTGVNVEFTEQVVYNYVPELVISLDPSSDPVFVEASLAVSHTVAGGVVAVHIEERIDGVATGKHREGVVICPGINGGATGGGSAQCTWGGEFAASDVVREFVVAAIQFSVGTCTILVGTEVVENFNFSCYIKADV